MNIEDVHVGRILISESYESLFEGGLKFII
jgi:hypothetical protein